MTEASNERVTASLGEPIITPYIPPEGRQVTTQTDRDFIAWEMELGQ